MSVYMNENAHVIKEPFTVIDAIESLTHSTWLNLRTMKNRMEFSASRLMCDDKVFELKKIMTNYVIMWDEVLLNVLELWWLKIVRRTQIASYGWHLILQLLRGVLDWRLNVTGNFHETGSNFSFIEITSLELPVIFKYFYKKRFLWVSKKKSSRCQLQILLS